MQNPCTAIILSIAGRFSTRRQRKSPGAKALIAVFFTARLNSCPDTKHHSRDYQNSASLPRTWFSYAMPLGPTVTPIWTVIRVETLSQSAKALLPPHKCGGSHQQLS